MNKAKLIALDWGTSALRAYLLSEEGEVIDEHRSDMGILKSQDFAQTLGSICQPWDERFGKLPCIASGMIGSKQGWADAGYTQSPAGFDAIASGAKDMSELAKRPFWIVPGIRHFDTRTQTWDVMRGEETQVFGAEMKDGIVALPGTHSKWVQVTGTKITSFSTFMTGEAFSLFRQHSILAKLMPAFNATTSFDQAAFRLGVQRSLNAPNQLLHHLFTVRTLGLFNELSDSAQVDYLSGLLIGNEVSAACQQYVGGVSLIGEANLIERYSIALACADLPVQKINPTVPVAAQGLFDIANRIC